MKYVEHSEKVVQQLTGKDVLQKYGRTTKMLIATKDIPNLQFEPQKHQSTSEEEECSPHSLFVQ